MKLPLVRYALAVLAILVVLGVPLAFAFGPIGDSSTKVEVAPVQPSPPAVQSPCAMPAVYIIRQHPGTVRYMRSLSQSGQKVAVRVVVLRLVRDRSPPDRPLRA